MSTPCPFILLEELVGKLEVGEVVDQGQVEDLLGLGSTQSDRSRHWSKSRQTELGEEVKLEEVEDELGNRYSHNYKDNHEMIQPEFMETTEEDIPDNLTNFTPANKLEYGTFLGENYNNCLDEFCEEIVEDTEYKEDNMGNPTENITEIFRFHPQIKKVEKIELKEESKDYAVEEKKLTSNKKYTKPVKPTTKSMQQKTKMSRSLLKTNLQNLGNLDNKDLQYISEQSKVKSTPEKTFHDNRGLEPKTGMEFADYDIMISFIQDWSQNSFSPIVTRNNSKYGKFGQSLLFVCCHGTKPRRSRSTGKRVRHGVKELVDCPVRLKFRRQKDGSFFLSNAITEHQNHIVSKENYKSQRKKSWTKLSPDQENVVLLMLGQGRQTRDIAAVLAGITGGRVDRKTVNNHVYRSAPAPFLDAAPAPVLDAAPDPIPGSGSALVPDYAPATASTTPCTD